MIPDLNFGQAAQKQKVMYTLLQKRLKFNMSIFPELDIRS